MLQRQRKKIGLRDAMVEIWEENVLLFKRGRFKQN